MAGVERRAWVVFDGKLDRFGSLAANDLSGEPERQVDTGRHAGGGDNFARVHDALVRLGFGAHHLEHAHLVSVRGGGEALQNPSGTQNQRAGTDGGGPGGRLVYPTEPIEHLIVYHLAWCGGAAWYEQ